MKNDQNFVSYEGQLLVAMPEMLDIGFKQTVSVICEHNPNGAIGILINRPSSQLNGKMVFDDLKINSLPSAYQIPIFTGGPVKPRQLFILHGPPFYWRHTVQISSDIALTTSIDVVNAIAMGEGPGHFLIALGYSGWANGQIEAEMMVNAWFLAPLDEKILFDTPVDQRWETAGQLIGINPNLICNTHQGSKLC